MHVFNGPSLLVGIMTDIEHAAMVCDKILAAFIVTLLFVVIRVLWSQVKGKNDDG